MADKLTSAVAVKMTDALHADGCASADGRRCNCADVLTALASPPTSTASGLPPSLRAALLFSILVTTAAWWLA